VIKQSKILRKQPVALQQPHARPSRIRRDPPARVTEKKVNAYPSEREVWMVALGVVLFALAITVVTIAVSGVTSPTGRIFPLN